MTPGDREKQLETYPELTGRRYDSAIDHVLEAVKKVAGMNGIRITRAEGDSMPTRSGGQAGGQVAGGQWRHPRRGPRYRSRSTPP